MILSDEEILERCVKEQMIAPFCDKAISVEFEKKIVSYGLSSYGYDIRVGSEFKIFTNAFTALIDPKNMDPKNFVDVESQFAPVSIPPNSFALARSYEFFRIPRDILVLCLGKSTYARCGIVVNVTPLEPEWEGHVTIEISNTTPNPALIYPNEGISQLIFMKSNKGCKVSYKDKSGKYQGQTGITLPSV